MKRPTLIWIIFACCLLVALGAMGSISLKTLQLDVNEARNHRAAEMEDNMRSALWRMDSNLGWLVAQENSRPYFVYNAFFPAERVSPRGLLDRKNGDLLVPSPLLTQLPDFVLLHFEIAPDGSISSPQAPTGNVRRLVESQYSTPERIGEASQRLEELRQIISREALTDELPKVKDQPDMPLALNRSGQYANNGSNSISNGNSTVQSNGGNNSKLFVNPAPNFRFNDNINGDQIVQRSQEDYQARAQSIRNTTDAQQLQNRYIDQNFTIASVSVNEGVMKPVWVGDALVLARHVSIGGHDYIQGCWIDWPAMKASLLQSVASFLPNADLHRVRNVTDDKQPHMLAALPARLVVPAPEPIQPSSPIRITLLVAWASAIVGAAAIAMLLGGVMSLSNRRAAFVSAVTHELRTPLTTLRMYTEMLADGMVRDDEKRASYLGTMRSEANRLGHLIENVLGYSRLERKRSAGRMETICTSDFLASVGPRLEERASQAQMKLVIDADDSSEQARLYVDVVALEQILFNLVDNACKYAGGAADPRIEVKVRRAGKLAQICVCDHGGGISPEHAKRLFRPFSKSVHEAARTKAPGLGLGLALSRRLARDMGGDLRLEQTGGAGACFVVSVGTAQG